MPLLELLENWGKINLTKVTRFTGATGGARFASVARIKRRP